MVSILVHGRLMADQIKSNIRKNYRSAAHQTVVETTTITEDMYKTIFGKRWIPSDEFLRISDRIRSRSLDITDSSGTNTDDDILETLKSELDIDITNLSRHIHLVIESVEEKTEELITIENELESTDTLIKEYETRMTRFQHDMSHLGEIMNRSISDSKDFFKNVRNSFVNELEMRGIEDKLNRHKLLLEQIRHLRSIIVLLIQKGDMTSDSIPSICKICMDNSIKYTLVPCGHCYCERCASRATEYNKCFLCRRDVDKLVKLYA